MKRICILTTVRNDTLFLRKWIDYYGAAFGRESLFVILDGYDQPKPTDSEGVNFITLPHTPLKRVPAMRRRAQVMSHFAKGLFKYFDIAIATDVDEFIVLDPSVGDDLGAYLSSVNSRTSMSSLGLDVAQHIGEEPPLDPSKPFLQQRSYAHLSSRYTKPNITFRPLTWGSGMHRIKGQNFHIDPSLYLFHFGMVDYKLATGKTGDKDRLATGWGEHLSRRETVFKIVSEATPKEGDSFFDKARKQQTWRRPIYALNKPAMMKSKPVVTIPERFRTIV